MDILLFGATRNTGFYAMQAALSAGHRVTAVIRDPSAFTFQHPNLTVVKGDALQAETFAHAMEGVSLVISSLGVTDGSKPTTLYSDGVQQMLRAMWVARVNRIICISASAIEINPQMNFFIRMAAKVLQRILKYPYGDFKAMERILSQSDTNWTVIRPPRLRSNAETGKYRVSVGGHLKGGYSIGRPDLAHYMIGHLMDENTFQQIVEIAY